MRGNFAIPIRLGAGKVWILHNGTTVNLFAEPQITIAHSGPGQPQFQIFAGLNLQFPIRRKEPQHDHVNNEWMLAKASPVPDPANNQQF